MKLTFLKTKAFRMTALYAGLFSLTAGAVYFSAPFLNGSLSSGGNTDDDEDVTVLSNSDRFMSKLTEITGLKATINTLDIHFPDKDGNSLTENIVSFRKGSRLMLAMPDTSNVGFHLDTAITLSTPGSDLADVSKDIFVNYDNQDLYVSLLGAKYRYVGSTKQEIMDDILSVLGEEDVTVNAGFYDIVKGLFGSMKGGQTDGKGFGFSFEETSKKDAKEHAFRCTLTYGEDSFPIEMKSDEDFNLTHVSANLIYQDIALNLDLLTDVNGGSLQTISSMTPENPESYVSLVNMKGTFNKIAKLLKAKRFGLSLEGSLASSVSDAEIDVTSLKMGGSVDYGKSDYRLALDIQNPKNTQVSQKLDLAYLPAEGELPKTAFLSYNDIYKVSMDQLSMDALLSRISKSAGNQEGVDAEKATALLGFLSESAVMKALAEGHYQPVIEMLDDLVTENDKIIATVRLSGLGFGKDSSVVVTIDGNKGDGENAIKLASIAFKNVELGKVAFNGTLFIDPLEGDLPSFKREGFNSLAKLPDIYDQMSALADSQRFGLSLKASLADEAGEPMKLEGSMQFDAKQSLGTGSWTVTALGKEHLLKADLSESDVRLQYQDAKKTDEKGTLAKVSVSTIQDLASYLGELGGEKSLAAVSGGFGSVLGEVALSQVLSDVQAGRYSVLASTAILKNYAFDDKTSTFTLDGALFGLASDPTFTIHYGTALSDGKATYAVESIEAALAFGQKTLNVTLGLKDYDVKKETSIDASYGDSDFNDFSYINGFARALGKTTSLSTYHVKAEADVTLWTANILHLDMEFAAYQGEKGWEYYAKLSNIPLIPAINSPYTVFFGYKRSVELLYREDTLYLSAINPFGEHGYKSEEDRENGERIDWTQTSSGTFSKDYLSKSENLLKFVLGDVLNVQPALLGDIASSESTMVLGPVGFDFGSLAYQNALESTSFDATTGDYSLSLNLGALFDTDYVSKVTIGAKKDAENRISQVSLDAFVFAGVRVDFSFRSALLDAGLDLSQDTKDAIQTLYVTASKGEAHTL